MLSQLFKVFRLAMLLQVCRRRTQRHTVIANTPRHQPTAAGQRSIADRQIKTVLNQVHDAIVK
ncbi:hypothetical protein D3C80_1924130 [compost metagenome]